MKIIVTIQQKHGKGEGQILPGDPAIEIDGEAGAAVKRWSKLAAPRLAAALQEGDAGALLLRHGAEVVTGSFVVVLEWPEKDAGG